MIRKLLLPAAFAAAALVSLPARADMGVYTIDASHSSVSFKIRHFFSKVPGKFDKFSGTVRFDPNNWAASSVEVTIEAASINTGNDGRDKHLRSEAFFDVVNHPLITFRSSKVEAVDATHLRVTGELMMRNATKLVVLEVEYTGSGRGFSGVTLAGFTAKTKINRLDYGVAWNAAVEGSNILGDDVEIELALETDLEPPPAPATAPASVPAKKKKK